MNKEAYTVIATRYKPIAFWAQPVHLFRMCPLIRFHQIVRRSAPHGPCFPPETIVSVSARKSQI